MTTHIYPSALVGLRDGTLSWTAEQIRAVFLGPNFVYDPSLVNVDELPAAHIIDTSDPIARRTYENGLAAGGPAAFIQLFDNKIITHVVLYQDVGDPVYSPLIMHYDVDSIIGAPKTPLGNDEYVYALSPPGGFFQLTSSELLGLINSYTIGANFTLAELEGGLTLVLPSVLLAGALRVHTQVVCVPREEAENCCEPTIRSSRC